jgi:hypothetical protein
MSLLPVPVDHSDDTVSEVVEHVAISYQSFLALSTHQKRILCAVLDDFMSSEFRTDRQIASDIGCNQKTVYNARRNPKFLQAIRDIMPEITSAKLPEVVSNAVKLSKKSVAAIEFVSRFSGAYVPKSQQLTVQARIDTRNANMSPDEVIDQFLGRLLQLGWSVDRIRERAQQIQDRL